MKKKRKIDNIREFFKSAYVQLFKINDTPQRIALGAGLGIFLGNFPGTGPIAALFLAWVLRLNRASALLGALFTNTWISFITFFLSVKAGSVILGTNWQDIQQSWLRFLQDFHWLDLLKLSILKIIFPIVLGYLIIGLFLGFLAYLTILVIFRYKKQQKRFKCQI
jgi:uncharacterized protein (DUF2062 family)